MISLAQGSKPIAFPHYGSSWRISLVSGFPSRPALHTWVALQRRWRASGRNYVQFFVDGGFPREKIPSTACSCASDPLVERGEMERPRERPGRGGSAVHATRLGRLFRVESSTEKTNWPRPQDCLLLVRSFVATRGNTQTDSFAHPTAFRFAYGVRNIRRAASKSSARCRGRAQLPAERPGRLWLSRSRHDGGQPPTEVISRSEGNTLQLRCGSGGTEPRGGLTVIGGDCGRSPSRHNHRGALTRTACNQVAQRGLRRSVARTRSGLNTRFHDKTNRSATKDIPLLGNAMTKSHSSPEAPRPGDG